MRALPSAKSRLVAATSGPAAHGRLVDAIRNDTLAAVADAGAVARIVLTVDRPWAASVVAHETYIQRGRGLNAALSEAQVWAQVRWPEDGVVALVGDLPALKAPDLDAALLAAEKHERAYVADAWAIGTTTLTARPGVELRPAFGPQSARHHFEIAASLAAAPSLQLDVDTPEDLEIGIRLGLGPRTTAFLAGEPASPNATPR
jgi:2-phospho-L-lactate guanylyltransferase